MEAHDRENVVIAVEPYDTREKESIFRVDYLGHGVMPIRLIVTNNGDRPIFLSEARILFLTAAGETDSGCRAGRRGAADDQKERQGSRIPMPGPIPAYQNEPKASDKEIEQDFDTFEYQALVVEPHTTRAGFLFYDVSQLNHPLMGAKFLVRRLRDADGNELFAFEIPFDKYLKSKSSSMN